MNIYIYKDFNNDCFNGLSAMCIYNNIIPKEIHLQMPTILL